jgi:mannose-binding lectin 2
MAFLVSCITLAAVAMAATATKLDSHSFAPPFEIVDSKGSRIISDLWQTTGDAQVNSNFIRLTPDRQSKRGAIWNRKSLGVDEFSAIVRMRISGQGEKFFGDGVGIWITDSPHHYDGSLHGSLEQFRGIGIILDTFKNTENLAAHRDILVLVNTGDKTLDEMIENTETIRGCVSLIAIFTCSCLRVPFLPSTLYSIQSSSVWDPLS